MPNTNLTAVRLSLWRWLLLVFFGTCCCFSSSHAAFLVSSSSFPNKNYCNNNKATIGVSSPSTTTMTMIPSKISSFPLSFQSNNKKNIYNKYYNNNNHHFVSKSPCILSMSLQQQQQDDGDDEGAISSSGISFLSSFSSSPLDRPVLAIVDCLALLGFAAVGKASHSTVDGSIDLVAVLTVAFPFILSWLVTSPLTGVYNMDNENKNNDNTLVQEAIIATKGWIVAIPLGIVLRGIIKGYIPPTSFIVVTMIATLIILILTRVVFAIVEDLFVEFV